MSDAPHLDAATPELRSWFDVPTLEQWRAEATRLLKGKPLEGLTRTLPEGVKVAPLHVGGGPTVDLSSRFSGGRWRFATVVDAGTPAEAAEALRVDLELGAMVRILPSPADRGASRAGPGVELGTATALATVLTGAAGQESLGQVKVEAGVRPAAWARACTAAVERLGRAADDLPSLVVDPLTELVRGGVEVADVERAFDEVVPLFDSPLAVSLAVSGLPFAEAGAHGVLELAATLAALVETFRQVDRRSVSEELLYKVDVRLSVGRDTFVEIAKLRAARLLALRLGQRSGRGRLFFGMTAVASPALFARHDPWTNLLRTTNATLAGALGGAHAVEAGPWDRALGQPDLHARRVALTSQSVLLHESELRASDGDAADPAAGAFLLEQLTLDLARAAWDLFREFERRGGLVAAHASGWLAEQLAASRAAADKAIGKRERGLVGVSLFPNPAEEVPTRPPAPPPSAWREAQGWEDLRDRASAAGVTAFLASLGPPDRHAARKGFVRPLLDAVGVRAAAGTGELDVDVLVAAFRASGAHGAVICGDDADYVDRVGPLATGLREAGARFVLLAGRPGEREAAWREAGLSGALFVGGDVLATLRAAVEGVLA